MNTRHTVRLLTAAVTLSALSTLTTGASAAGPQDPSAERFDAMLMAIDIVPTRAQLLGAWPDAQERLMNAAADRDRTDYPRVRALSLLSHFPDQTTRSYLARLGSDPRPDIRRIAVYTAARAFGVPGDEALVGLVQAAERDPVLAVREHAVRALRWIDHDAARRHLERIRATGEPALARLATVTHLRRARRLARRAP